MMRTPDGHWSVEVITTRGSQSFRVKNNFVVASETWAPTGKLCRTIDEVKFLIGEDAFRQLAEVRVKRFDGGR